MPNSQVNNVQQISIVTEMRNSYVDYSMSVIVGRAIPDVRDGMKPVNRRILFAMDCMRNHYDKAYKKSARVVGDTIGKYHPHGDAPIYMALVRMAQEFSLRDPLVDGQGNFGSIDGDSPAAMRYTEVRLSKIASWLLEDIDQNTVDFQDNYDGSEREPLVLPARFPNLLINGGSGIAVGMATNIPTHNLGEVMDACIAYVKNPAITQEEISDLVPAPDFPTGGLIVGATQARHAIATGRGTVTMRGKVDIEEVGGYYCIVIKELPYQVNKAELVKKIEQLSKDKVIEHVSELRDESNKLGIRVVVELKRDANPDIVLNKLYRHTELQTNFSVNMLSLSGGQPVLMGIRDIIAIFIAFRNEIVTRRTIFELNKARDKAHILIGLSLAVSNIDQVIGMIRSSANTQEAKRKLMDEYWDAEVVSPLLKLVADYRNDLIDGRCKFTQEQVEAILDMKLSKLTNLEKGKIEEELFGLSQNITELLNILNSKEVMDQVILNELQEVKDLFATPRRSQIISDEKDFDDEDFIAREEVVITRTLEGFIKRVPLDTYKAQKRGGKGRSGMATYNDDLTTDIVVASTHAPLLFFSSYGKVYRTKVYKLPAGSPQSKGKALINFLPLEQSEKITTILPLPEDETLWNNYNIIFATKKGGVRRNEMSAFSNINANGKIAIRLDEGDELIGVNIATESDHILLCTKEGRALRFPVESLRIVKGRNTDGVRGVTLGAEDDVVVSMAIVSEAKASVEQRDEYLKIPVDARLNYAITGNVDEFKTIISENNLTIDPDIAIELASSEQFILSVTENGYGKRTSLYEYRVTNRGGLGITNIVVDDRNGKVVASMPAKNDQEVILLSSGGTLIRTKISDIRVISRNTKGVKIISVADGEKVISVSTIAGYSDDVIDAEDDNDCTEE